MSELAVIVETETRLDRLVDAARADGEAAIAAARHRAAEAEQAIEREIASAGDQVRRDADEATAARCAEIARAADDQRQRYDAVRGDVLVALARTVIAELLAGAT